MIDVPRWIQQIPSEERFNNIIMRTNTKEIGVFIVEQEANEFTLMIPDDVKMAYILDVLLREIEDVYGVTVPYTNELSYVSQIGYCGTSDLEKYCPFLTENEINIYTLEYYILHAFNALVADEDESTLLNVLYSTALNNVILDMISDLDIKNDWDKLSVYDTYNYIVMTFMLYFIAKGKKVFPLSTIDFKRSRVEKIFEEICNSNFSNKVSPRISSWLGLYNKENTNTVMKAYMDLKESDVIAFNS